MFNVDTQPLLTNREKQSRRLKLFKVISILGAFAILCFVAKGSKHFEAAVGGNVIEGISQPDTPRVQSPLVPGSPVTVPTAGSSVPQSPAVGPTNPGPSPMLPATAGNVSPGSPSSPKAPAAAAPTSADPPATAPAAADAKPASSADMGSPSQTEPGPSGEADEEDETEESGAVPGTVVLDVPPEAAAVEGEGAGSSSGAKCTDEINGYEKNFGKCADVRVEHKYQRTAWESTYIPMVIDSNAHCKKDKCTARDKFQCCKFRRICTNYAKDVAQGCPAGMAINPYEGAFCRSYPCTIADSDICCVPPTGQIFKRIDMARSKYARVDADDKAKKTIPHVSFSYGLYIWTDISQKTKVGDDEWVPLKNFMESWGEGKGWSEPAWIKFSKNGKAKYEQVVLPVTTTANN